MQLADPYGFEPEIAESKSAVLPLHQGSIKWSAQQDLNLRHPAPKAGALARLSHTPIVYILYLL
jgi:hypothetical protein